MIATRRAFLAVLIATGVSLACTSCSSAPERRAAREQAATGDLRGARDRLLNLLDSHDSATVRADLEAVELDMAQAHLARAREHWQRGSLRLARRELCAVLLLDPAGVEARFRLAELDRAEAREQQRRQAFCAAVDALQWERALWLLADDGHAAQMPRGRAVDLMARAWADLEREFSECQHVHDRRTMEAIVARAVGLRDAFPEVLALCGVDAETSMARWQGAIALRRSADRLVREAHAHTRNLEPQQAYEKMRQAALTLPHDPQLRTRAEDCQEHLLRALLARLDTATRARDWGLALAVTDDLDQLGWRPGAERPLPIAEMRRRHTEELLAEADRFERRGLPGNALLAVMEACAACDHPPDLLARAARLRDAVSSLPLVVLASGTDAAAPLPGSALVVRAGEPRYSEKRSVLVQQTEGVLTRTEERWSDNPAHAAEVRRRARAEDRVSVLYDAWQNADPIGRAHAERRYLIALADLERTRERLRTLPERQRQVVWEAQPVAVEIHEVQARLEQELVIEARAGTRTERSIVCEERVTDRHVPPDPAHGVPGDPAELPEREELEKQLARDSEEQLATLLGQLERDEYLALVDRVEAALTSGRVAEGVELAVRALLAHTGVPDDTTSARLRDLLRRWTKRTPRTLDALVRQ